MKIRAVLLLLIAALCLSVFASCTPKAPVDETPSEDKTPTDTEDPVDPGKDDPDDKDGEDDEDDKVDKDRDDDEEEENLKYQYPDGEYEQKLELFGSREDYFAPGGRSDTYAVTVEQLAGGLYTQSRDAVETEGVRTYASVDRAYSEAMHVNVDAYIVSPQYAKDYRKRGYDIIGTSNSFQDSDYAKNHPEVLQAKPDGSTDGLWDSVVLTRDVVEYNCRSVLRDMINRSNWATGFVEPEMFRDGLYGQAYKELWALKYGEDWTDPISTVRSIFLSQRLNVWTHSNAIKMYASYTHEHEDSELLYSLAPHSTLAYTTYGNGITDGYVHMMGTGLVETVTGQTWSNTIENSFRYQGQSVQQTFINAYVDYGTYLDAANYYGADFYALCDPMSDTHTQKAESYWRQLCHEQLVASMMYSEINRWELIWTNRAFMNVSHDYRSEQLNIHNALLEISGAEYKATAGTPGITYLLGDTLSWQSKNVSFAENAYDGFWGVAAPLVYDGIPLRTMAMELITSAEDLKDVSVLIVSYDNQKPLYEEANIAIAQWVKEGGTLLYLGGPDEYLNIAEAWWNQEGKGGSPTANLLQHLGVDSQIKVNTLVGNSSLLWTGGEVAVDAPDYKDGGLSAGGNAYTYYYEGSGYDALLKTESGKDIGITFGVGEGRVLMVGLSTTDYSDSACSADLMRMLTAKALQSTEYQYVTSDAFVAERGDYTAVYPLNGEYTLKGTYVNIFSTNLDLVIDPVVKQGEAALYRRVTDLGELTQPTVMYSGGFVESVEESADSTVITLYAADNALIPIRIAAPDGMVPTDIYVTYEDGISTTEHIWDETTNSLVIKPVTSPTRPATVTVYWEENGKMLNDMLYESFKIMVNSSGEDAEYIVSNNGGVNGNMRFCDHTAQIVWAFDVSDYEGLFVSASVIQNYVIEVSGDGENYTEVVNFSKLSSIPSTGTNEGVVTILMESYPEVVETLYIRLRSSTPNQGWGGAIKSFTFQYLVEQD